MSASLYVFDFVILLLEMTFSNVEESIYGILLIFIYTFILDRVLTLGMAQSQVKIVSKKHAEINSAIHAQLDRGTTLVQAETGFLHKESQLVLTVVSKTAPFMHSLTEARLSSRQKPVFSTKKASLSLLLFQTES